MHALAEEDQLWTPLVFILASYVHMHCNRLLGINRLLEFEIAYHLHRTLESLQHYVPEGVHV